MATLAQFLIVLFGVLFLLAAHVRFWRSRYRVVLDADATYYARASDGWRLALHRYHGGAGEPVLLCHGVANNGFIFDLGSHVSLARYLRDRGFDVWVLELRGVGFSRWYDTTGEAALTWSFDDHLIRDVPAAIARVLAETGQERLHWVGHSMGGLLAYAHLGTRGDAGIASLCTLGSAGDFEDLGPVRRFWPFLRFLGFFPTIRTRSFVGAGIPLYRSLPVSFLTHHGRNVATREVRRGMANLIEPISRRTLVQLSRWLKTGEWRSYEGSVDYGASLKEVTPPTCVIAGSGDAIAPPANVRRAYDALGATLKEYHVIGREHGASAEYGHGDLILGKAAFDEVYPLVARWLEERRAGRARPAGRAAAMLASGMRVRALDLAEPLRAEPAPSSAAPTGSEACPVLTGRNPYDPYARRLRERWVRRGGRPPQPGASTPAPAAARIAAR